MCIESFISEIDTQRFGFKIAKINEFNEGFEDLVNDLRNVGVKLIISRVPSDNVVLVNRLEELNFRIKDTQLTFMHDLKGIDAFQKDLINKENIKVVLAKKEDVNDVGKIALQSFKGYGHYSANKMLDPIKSNEIYEDWAKKSCIDKNVADYMFVAKLNNKIGGFLSLKIVNDGSHIYGIQHLGAVDKDYRNMDIFRLLIKKCLMVGIANNHNWQQTFLLSTNIPVMRSYIKIGFKISGSNYTMHSWL